MPLQSMSTFASMVTVFIFHRKERHREPCAAKGTPTRTDHARTTPTQTKPGPVARRELVQIYVCIQLDTHSYILYHKCTQNIIGFLSVPNFLKQQPQARPPPCHKKDDHETHRLLKTENCFWHKQQNSMYPRSIRNHFDFHTVATHPTIYKTPSGVAISASGIWCLCSNRSPSLPAQSDLRIFQTSRALGEMLPTEYSAQKNNNLNKIPFNPIGNKGKTPHGPGAMKTSIVSP